MTASKDQNPTDFLNMTSLKGIHEIRTAISTRWNSDDFAPSVAALHSTGLIQGTPKKNTELNLDGLAGVTLVDAGNAKTSANIALGHIHEKGGKGGPATV